MTFMISRQWANGAILKTIQITPIATALILGIVANAILTRVENGKKKNNET